MQPSATTRFVGVTVLPEYIQSEGIDGVLDNLVMRCGANAVATSPYLMQEADESTGQREPPSDAGAGGARLLDRPLWGRRELFVRTTPSFAPQRSLYRGLKYQPAEPSDLTRQQGPLIQQFIRAAQARHLKVYLQVQAAIPPGYRVQFGGPDEEDLPRMPDGRVPAKRVSKNGSLASAAIIAYTQALLRDLCQQYPDLDGLRIDWPEYPPYSLDDMFVDFSSPAQAATERLQFDYQRMHQDVSWLYEKLHGNLQDTDLLAWTEQDGGRFALARLFADRPGLADWLRFKATLVEELLAACKAAVDQASGSRMQLMPNAFPPPWTLVSGMDFRRAAAFSSAISVKHYTMHWPMMLRFYADQLRAANPQLNDGLLAQTLLALFDISDDATDITSCEQFYYPPPDERHAVGAGALERKIEQAQREAGATPIYALVHGYGPADDFRARLTVGWKASQHRIWINRYGYLDDTKLDLIGEVTRGS